MGSYYSEYPSCVYRSNNPCQNSQYDQTAELYVAYTEIGVYSMLVLLSLIRLFLRNPQIHSVLIPLLALVRLSNYVLQPLNLFANLTFIYRHVYYVLPLAILLVIYSNVIIQWTKFMKRNQRFLKAVLICFSILSLAIFAVSVILYYLCDFYDLPAYKDILVPSTAICMGVCYLILCVVNCVCFYFVKPLYDLHIFSETRLVLISLTISTICFLVYSLLIITESAFELKLKGFYFFCCVQGQVYTTYWWLELIYLVVQCVPMFGLTLLGFRVQRKEME
ncbi:Conserved_hypothetical protein [Hexamita inflata]|uniref:Uncharacterized protein n=1 Tax=Hexamita inflata TaxID=28002 RepID=A0AA86UD54_9EUKA|nr:Conserved hypothetical protein [Hexamita inflata]